MKRASDGLTRVTGLGGVFFKSRDPLALRRWYHAHLGIGDGDANWAVFGWRDAESEGRGETVWSLFPADTTYFGDASQQAMLNYRVRDLEGLLRQLATEGVRVLPERHTDQNGRFAWIVDPEGNRIELWEPAEGH